MYLPRGHFRQDTGCWGRQGPGHCVEWARGRCRSRAETQALTRMLLGLGGRGLPLFHCGRSSSLTLHLRQIRSFTKTRGRNVHSRQTT